MKNSFTLACLLNKSLERCVIEPPGNTREMKPSCRRKLQSNSVNDPRPSQPLDKLGNNIEHCSLNARIENVVMATGYRLRCVPNLAITTKAKKAGFAALLPKKTFYSRMNAIKPKRWNQPHTCLLTHPTQQGKTILFIK